jgi:hypothetical protein
MLTAKSFVGVLLLALLNASSALALVPLANAGGGNILTTLSKYIVELENLSVLPTKRSPADTVSNSYILFFKLVVKPCISPMGIFTHL